MSREHSSESCRMHAAAHAMWAVSLTVVVLFSTSCATPVRAIQNSTKPAEGSQTGGGAKARSPSSPYATTSLNERAPRGTDEGQSPEFRPSIEVLIERLQSEDRRVVSYASELLSEMAAEGLDIRATLPALIDCLSTSAKRGNPNPAAIEALGDIGPSAREAVPDLLKILGTPFSDSFLNYYARSLAAKALAKIGAEPVAVVTALRRELNENESPEIRAAAASSLGSFRSHFALFLPDLILALRKDDTFGVHGYILESLAELGPVAEEAIPIVLEKLREDNFGHPNTYKAARTLSRIARASRHATTVVDVLIEALGSRHHSYPEEVAKALVEFSEADIDALIDMSKSRPSSGVVNVLGHFGRGSEKAVSRLCELTAGSSRQPRYLAIWWLGRIGQGDRRTVSRLREILRLGDVDVVPRDAVDRLFAFDALQQLGENPGRFERLVTTPPTTTRQLMRALSFGDERLFQVTRTMMLKIGQPMIPHLIDGLSVFVHSGLYKWGKPLSNQRSAAILEEMGQAAIPLLVERLRRPDRERLRRPDPGGGYRATEVLQKLNWRPEEQPMEIQVAYFSIRNDFEGLARLGEPALPAIVEKARQTDNHGTRQSALKVLAEMRAQDSIPIIVDGTRDAVESTRVLAYELLADLLDKDSFFTFIERASEDPSAIVRGKAIGSLRLKKYSPKEFPTFPLVRRALRDGDSFVRFNAFAFLEKYGREERAEVIDDLILMLAHEEAVDRNNAAIVLGKIDRCARLARGSLLKSKATDIVTILAGILRTGAERQGRVYVAETLGSMGKDAESALPALREAENTDSQEAVREACGVAVEKIARAVKE